MKQQVNPTIVAVVVGVVVVAIAVGAMVFFNGSVPGSSGPPLEPQAWKPPANWSNATGGGNGAPAGTPGGAPVGAPASPSGSK